MDFHPQANYGSSETRRVDCPPTSTGTRATSSDARSDRSRGAMDAGEMRPSKDAEQIQPHKTSWKPGINLNVLETRMADLVLFGVENLPNTILGRYSQEAHKLIESLRLQSNRGISSVSEEDILPLFVKIGFFAKELSTRKDEKSVLKEDLPTGSTNAQPSHNIRHDLVAGPIAVQDFPMRPVAAANSQPPFTSQSDAATKSFDRWKTCGWCRTSSFHCKHFYRLVECMIKRFSGPEFVPLLEHAHDTLSKWNHMKTVVFPGDPARQRISSSDLFLQERTSWLNVLGSIINKHKSTVFQTSKEMPVASLEAAPFRPDSACMPTTEAPLRVSKPPLPILSVKTSDLVVENFQTSVGEQSRLERDVEHPKKQNTDSVRSPQPASTKRKRRSHDNHDLQHSTRRRKFSRRKSSKSIDSAVFLSDDHDDIDETESSDSLVDSRGHVTTAKLEKRLANADTVQLASLLHEICMENRYFVLIALRALCKDVAPMAAELYLKLGNSKRVRVSRLSPQPLEDPTNIDISETDESKQNSGSDVSPRQKSPTESDELESGDQRLVAERTEDAGICQNCGTIYVSGDQAAKDKCTYHPGQLVNALSLRDGSLPRPVDPTSKKVLNASPSKFKWTCCRQDRIIAFCQKERHRYPEQPRRPLSADTTPGEVLNIQSMPLALENASHSARSISASVPTTSEATDKPVSQERAEVRNELSQTQTDTHQSSSTGVSSLSSQTAFNTVSSPSKTSRPMEVTERSGPEECTNFEEAPAQDQTVKFFGGSLASEDLPVRASAFPTGSFDTMETAEEVNTDERAETGAIRPQIQTVSHSSGPSPLKDALHDRCHRKGVVPNGVGAMESISSEHLTEARAPSAENWTTTVEDELPLFQDVPLRVNPSSASDPIRVEASEAQGSGERIDSTQHPTQTQTRELNRGLLSCQNDFSHAQPMQDLSSTRTNGAQTLGVGGHLDTVEVPPQTLFEANAASLAGGPVTYSKQYLKPNLLDCSPPPSAFPPGDERFLHIPVSKFMPKPKVDMSKDPQKELLHVSERWLATELGLSGAVYLEKRKLLFAYCLVCYQNGTQPSRSEFRDQFGEDGYIRPFALWFAFERVGWLHRDYFENWLSPTTGGSPHHQIAVSQTLAGQRQQDCDLVGFGGVPTPGLNPNFRLLLNPTRGKESKIVKLKCDYAALEKLKDSIVAVEMSILFAHLEHEAPEKTGLPPRARSDRLRQKEKRVNYYIEGKDAYASETNEEENDSRIPTKSSGSGTGGGSGASVFTGNNCPWWATGTGDHAKLARRVLDSAGKVYPLGEGCKPCVDRRRLCVYSADPNRRRCASCSASAGQYGIKHCQL